MRRAHHVAVLMLVVVGLVAVAHTTPIPASAQPRVNCDVPNGDAPFNADESAAFAALNAYRQSRGLAVLAPSRALTRAARWKAAAMAAGAPVIHDDPNRTWEQRVRDCGYAPAGILENLGAGPDTAAEVIALWQGSAEHNTIMLSQQSRVAGIGRATGGPFGAYWVLVLGAAPVEGDTLPLAVPPAGQGGTETVRLFTGCNMVALTWATGTPASQVAAAVTPAGSLQVIWRFDNQTKRFAAFSPIPGAPSDFTTVNRNDAVYLCVSSDGQMQRPG